MADHGKDDEGKDDELEAIQGAAKPSPLDFLAALIDRVREALHRRGRDQ